MATLALAVAGAAIGGALLPASVTFLGAALSGAAIGAQIGSFAGSYVDAALFGASGQSRPVEGPRLKTLYITTSTEGAAIPRVYGLARVGGQVIWADEVEERRKVHRSGGKGGALAPEVRQVEYTYFASFAVALAEGVISGIGRVWADGDEVDLSRLSYRVYNGTETQAADSLIEAKLGPGASPAFRGTAYIVFESLALADFGNRIPQLSFEIHRSVDGFDQKIKGVVLIPGSGEFVYAQEAISKKLGGLKLLPENVHTRAAATDWAASLDQLNATLPNAKSVSLVVSWFGTDLRCGSCQVKPGVDLPEKTTKPLVWKVAGVARSAAHQISTIEGRAAYGGTPADVSVMGAIADLKDRGCDVVMTPFVLMDIPAGNALPDPYGAGAQAPYPWRGRITCHPAAGQPGTVDKTAAAAAQLSAFVGSAQVSDFSITLGEVEYTGPAEWSYRRMVLHYAHLAKAAGGVTAFLVGTELRGLTWIRSGATTYPFVAALQALAADVKAVLGSGTQVIYAADWSEYFGHQPADGTGDVAFHLDPLWASADIDAIGIDLYWPLADWRDGASHLDYAAGTRSIHDLAYLRANVQGGEGYDWHYASESARAAQVRTPITDGAGKPWVFRTKDVKSWWSNSHYDRPGGMESATATSWVPQSKPFWFMEIGCPAVDKGANQPNVFVDPKSAESALPYFSRGTRDDAMQRGYLQALIEAFDPASENYVAGANPVSIVTGTRMVDLERIHVYCWDARPYPAFPAQSDVWGDGENWRLGHWLNGRFSSAPLAALVHQLHADYGFEAADAGRLSGSVPGYVVERVMSAREALQPLELAYFLDSLESDGKIVHRHRGRDGTVASYATAELVEDKPEAALLTLIRGQETDLPASSRIAYSAAGTDYRPAVAEARRLTGVSGRVAQAELAIVLDAAQAEELADTWLHETWVARERARFTLPPSALRIEPGDVVSVTPDGAVARLLRVTDVADRGAREIDARTFDATVYDATPGRPRGADVAPEVLVGQPLITFLDLPLLTADQLPQAGFVAAAQDPWPGGIAIYSSPEDSGFALREIVPLAATIGEAIEPFLAGPTAVLDRVSTLKVELYLGELTSVTELQLLNGANAAAVRNSAGDWEVLQFATATLVAPRTYVLSGLLRGLGGTEAAMEPSLAAGAPFVLLDAAVRPVPLALDEINLPLIRRAGPVSRAIGDATYISQTHAFTGAGLRPYAPVHVHGLRTGGGDIGISWIRRTRIGGDAWAAGDVALGEETERYELDVLSGASVVRTLTATGPAVTYTAAQQTADFGAPQSSVAIALYQIGAVTGRGTAARATV